jgi:predicted TIM-barrel fold metal-dependent hydrolase
MKKNIDMHVHCFPPHIAQYALKATVLRENFAGDGTIVGERQLMKEFGITCSVMLSMATRPDTQDNVNRFAMQVNSKDIIAFGSVHPFFPNAIESVEKFSEKVQEIGGERVFFGTNLPCGNIWEKINFLKKKASFSEEEKRQIFYSNAVKLLKL